MKTGAHASIQASPNPVRLLRGDEPAAVTLAWACDASLEIEVHVDSPAGPLLARGVGPGRATTGPWVQDGMTFHLQNVTCARPLVGEHTLASVTVGVTVAGESGQKRAAVLAYHRITRETSDAPGFCVAPHHFAEHLEVLSRRCAVVSLAELARGVKKDGLPDRAAVVTFDDGYADALSDAWPILERYGIPATVFVVSGFLSDRPGYRPDPGDFCGGRPLSSEELRKLADAPLIEIGAHTVTHPRLAELPREGQRAEVEGSKRALEELLGHPVRHFAYPHGSCGPETPSLVASAGFECACSASGGFVTAGSDLFRLPRMNVSDWDREEFSRRLDRWLAQNS